jgi:hypothetical protein
VQIRGYHYHNADRENQADEYVRGTLIRQLREGSLQLPAGAGGDLEPVTMKELGVSCPVLVNPMAVYEVDVIDPSADLEAARGGMGMPGPGGMPMGPGVMPMGPGGGMGMGGMGRSPVAPGAGGAPGAGTIRLKQFDFIVQFCWQPKTPSERHDAKKAAEKPK